MIHNTDISLHPSSAFRKDALNSLKHTLLLKYEIPQTNTKSQLIPEVMKSCQKCCQGLFIDTYKSSDEKINFDFFGTLSSLDDATLKDPSHQLSFLDRFPPNKDMYPNMKEVGFPTMILDHCVLSCYHAVITELLGNKTVTSYEIRNDIKSYGIHSLYKNGILNFDPEPGLKKKNSSSCENSKRSSSASDFGKKAQSHLKQLSSTQSLFKDADANATNGFFLQFADVFSHICDIDVRNWYFLSSKTIDNSRTNILEKFESLSQDLFPKADKNSLVTVDEMYRYYIIERISNFKLIAFLLKNIAHIEKKTSYSLCQNDLLKDVLCLCHKLPNIFSRQYFLQYAFDKLINKPISYLDFWHAHKLDMNTSVLESPLKDVKHFQFIRWLEQFSLFCNYMSEYVIPLYEWCFTNMLMDAIEQTSINVTDAHKKTNNETSIYQTNLLTAFDVLSEYIQSNSRQIIYPVPFPKQPSTLSFVIEPTRDIQFLDIPVATIQKLFQLCFLPEELDLNLHQINPDFFLNIKKNYKDSNFKQTQNFYINLLYPG